jgi:methionyl-tRNA formyltransferase
LIDWTRPAAEIERLVRAFTSWPGTYTFWNGQILKILSATTGPGEAPPGKVIRTDQGIAIGTGDGLLYPARLQLPGGKPLAVADFVRGHATLSGAQLSAAAG